MPSKDDFLRQLRSLSSIELARPGAYEEKLKEWVSVLHEGFPEVSGSVSRFSDMPLILSVELWPSLRPIEANNMFNVAIQGDKAILMGSERTEFESAEALWGGFLEFINDSQFQSSLLEMKRRNCLDSVGGLSTKTGSGYDGSAVPVRVSVDILKRIERNDDGPFTVDLMEDSPHYQNYGSKHTYRRFYVNGFAVEIDAIKESSSSQVTVEGKRNSDWEE